MKHVIVIGGGMSGLASAYLLSKKGIGVTLIEKEPELGGLASSFVYRNKILPQSYHHILSKDKALVSMLKELGVYPKVRWKHIKLVFWINKRYYNLANPIDLIAAPMGITDKIRFVHFMLRCFAKNEWSGLNRVNAKKWLDSWANSNIRETIFEPMCNIKFGVSTEQLSASWLGARIHAREGSSLFGYVPGINWAYLIVKRFEHEITKNGGRIIKGTAVKKLLVNNNKVTGVVVKKKTLRCDIIISTMPTCELSRIIDKPIAPKIEYVNTVSCIVGTKQDIGDFYWMVCLKPRMSFGGIFQLSSLNKNIGVAKENVINFFTNVNSGDKLLERSDREIFEIYADDFKSMTGIELKPSWCKVFKINNSSPKFVKGYPNPKTETSVDGLYLAGAYKEYPMLTSTGTAIYSGLKTAKIILHKLCKCQDCLD